MKSVRELMTSAETLEKEVTIRAESLEGLIPLEVPQTAVAEHESEPEEETEEASELDDFQSPGVESSGLDADMEIPMTETPSFELESTSEMASVAIEDAETVDPADSGDSVSLTEPESPQIESGDVSDVPESEVANSELSDSTIPDLESADPDELPSAEIDTAAEVEEPETQIQDVEESEDYRRLPTVDSPGVTDAELPTIGSDDLTDPESPVVEQASDEQGAEPEVESAESSELPDVSVSPAEQTEPDDPSVSNVNESELPDVDISIPDLEPPPETPQQEPVGLQGVTVSEPMTQQQADEQLDFSSPQLSIDEKVDKQLQFQMKANEDLASRLAQEITPSFDEMREHQTQVVHDYFQEQQLLTSLLRAR